MGTSRRNARMVSARAVEGTLSSWSHSRINWTLLWVPSARPGAFSREDWRGSLPGKVQNAIWLLDWRWTVTKQKTGVVLKPGIDITSFFKWLCLIYVKSQNGRLFSASELLIKACVYICGGCDQVPSHQEGIYTEWVKSNESCTEMFWGSSVSRIIVLEKITTSDIQLCAGRTTSDFCFISINWKRFIFTGLQQTVCVVSDRKTGRVVVHEFCVDKLWVYELPWAPVDPHASILMFNLHCATRSHSKLTKHSSSVDFKASNYDLVRLWNKACWQL